MTDVLLFKFPFIMCANVYTNKKNLNHNCEPVCQRPSSEFVIVIFVEVGDKKALSAFEYESYVLRVSLSELCLILYMHVHIVPISWRKGLGSYFKHRRNSYFFHVAEINIKVGGSHIWSRGINILFF